MTELLHLPFKEFKEKEETAPARKWKKNGWVLDEGNAWNPLTQFPRNAFCFCGSKTKAKKCCLSKISRFVPEGVAKKILKNWNELRSNRATLKQVIDG